MRRRCEPPHHLLLRRYEIPVWNLRTWHPREADVLIVEQHLPPPASSVEHEQGALVIGLGHQRNKSANTQVGLFAGFSSCRKDRCLAGFDRSTGQIPAEGHPRRGRPAQEEQHATGTIFDDHGGRQTRHDLDDITGFYR